MAMTAQQKREARAAKKAAEAAAREAGQKTETEKLNEAAFQNPGGVRDAHGELQRPGGSSTVTVACKLGIAHIDLQLCEVVDKTQEGSHGPKTVKEAIRVGKVVRIRGTAYPRGTPPEGFPERPLIVAGAAMNPGVDREWFEAWLKQNRLNPLVVNGMIFAHEKTDHVVGRAREEAANTSGLEPVDPKKKDRRIPKSSREEIEEIGNAREKQTA